MNFTQRLNHLLAHQELSGTLMQQTMTEIMAGQMTPAQIGAFLTAMEMKGATSNELYHAALVIREAVTPVSIHHPHLVDVVGTGGDGSQSFNISTASALVAAEAGACVAKHGNRAVSGRTGSADVLEAAGVVLDLSPLHATQCLQQWGFCYLFAPHYHQAWHHAVKPRRELGIKTLFNLLGPMTSPAATTRQVLGVYGKQWVRPMAEVLQALGSEHAMVVHGLVGIDEISLSGATQVAELKDGKISEYTLTPEDFGLNQADLQTLQVADAQQSLRIIQQVLSGQIGPCADVVALNAGAVIYCANLASSLAQGIAHAQQILQSGLAAKRLQQIAYFSQQIQQKLP